MGSYILVSHYGSGEFIATTPAQPLLSWIAPTADEASEGLRAILEDIEEGRA